MSRFDDDPGPMDDPVQQYKVLRGHQKGRLTKIQRAIRDLMHDRDNASTVTSQLKLLDVIFKDFTNVHKQYHDTLRNAGDIQMSQAYYNTVKHEIDILFDEASDWCLVASRLQEAENVLSGHDRVAHLSTHIGGSSCISHNSRSTKTSSIGSAKLKIAAKKAALLAEAASLHERRSLEIEELQLQQKRRELDVKVELAKADAEENVYSELERGNELSVHDGMNDYLDQGT